MRPLISTIIPAFNAERTLVESVQSAQSQSIREIEILIIDDGSTDKTLNIANSIAANDSRVKVIRQANAGAAAARNAGLDTACGEYVFFLDADDLVCEGAYEHLLTAQRSFNCEAAVGSLEMVSEAGESLFQTRLRSGLLGITELMLDSPIGVDSQLLRRDAIADLRFDTSYAGYEDQDFWFRLAERGVRWNAIPRVVGRYRMTRGSLSKQHSMLPCAEDVYIRAQRRNGAITETQLRELLGEFAVAHSTRAALLSPDGVRHAAALMAGARCRPAISSHLAAACGHSQAIFGLCVWPFPAQPLPGNQTLVTRLKEWWLVCANNGWMRQEDLAEAVAEFTQLCVPPQRIAQSILSVSSPDITLVGFGRNAKWFLKQPTAGRRIFVRDDRFAQGANRDDVPEQVTVEDMNAPVPVGRTVIVTPIEDEALARRFPGAFRWKLVRDELARFSQARKHTQTTAA